MTRMPAIVPQLPYQDIAAALDWLTRVFGFRERSQARMTDPDGSVLHAEMEAGGGVIMLGVPGGHGSSTPRSLGGVSQHLVVYVEDVEGHFATAQAAGATIRAELEDKFWGDRTYEAEDLEGHHWAFHQHVRDVPADPWDWKRRG